MNNICILKYVILAFLINSCMPAHKIISGTYISGCYLYHMPERIIYMNNDYTHITVCPYMNAMYWEGRWHIKSDTLFMTDEYEVLKNGEKRKVDSSNRLYYLEFTLLRGLLIIHFLHFDFSKEPKSVKTLQKITAK